MAHDSERTKQGLVCAAGERRLDEEPIASASVVADDVTDLGRRIDTVRTQLAQYRDEQTVAQLADLLRRRFFCQGQRADMDEYLELHRTLPDVDLAAFEPIITSFHPELRTREHRWAQWQPWLLSVGYELYPRYRPGWIPSWVDASSQHNISLYSDDPCAYTTNIMYAIRCRDRRQVCLKLCPEARPSFSDDPDRPAEIQSYVFFSSEPQRSDPRNHCCPLLDLIRTPVVDGSHHFIVVLPLLRNLTSPLPTTVEESVHCVLSLAEGLAYMHEHNFAHRDIHFGNALMDASQLLPSGWHPFMPFRTYSMRPTPSVERLPLELPRPESQVNFYFIDFGLSVHFESSAARKRILGFAGLKLVPELSNEVPYDPFAVDIRQFGDLVVKLHKGTKGLGFLLPIIARARSGRPSDRLTAAELLCNLRAAVNARSPYLRMLPLHRMSARNWVLYARAVWTRITIKGDDLERL